MHTEFQTYLMRTTTELVQSFQVKNHPSTNNVAIISLVYDEVTNSVDLSNIEHSKITLVQDYTINIPNSFSGYPHPFHPSQMIT